jgi:preprotein translocase subunit SecG
MKNILPIITVVSAILLICVILLQNQGSGLGAAYGGDSNFYRSKRGAEKTLFVLTIVLAILFVGSILGALVVH